MMKAILTQTTLTLTKKPKLRQILKKMGIYSNIDLRIIHGHIDPSLK